MAGQKKMKNIIISVLITIIVGMFLATLAGYLFYKKSFKTENSNLTVKNRVESNKKEDEIEADGEYKDEFGCIPSAGYSWCEEKQKCLREWEEECEESIETGIIRALAKKHEKDVSEISVSVKQEKDGYASGRVEFAPGGPGNAGMYLVIRRNNDWEIIFEGNGNPDCETLKLRYDFPENMLDEFCN